MTDVILIATIVAFFVAGALLVRALDRMIKTGSDIGADDEEPEPEPGPAR